MRYLTLHEVLDLHRRVIAQWGGTYGIHDLGALQSSIAQPRMTFGQEDLYPTIVEKASALGYSFILNHPFVDVNERTGHALMETFLMLNEHELQADAQEQEGVILALASGMLSREKFTEWMRGHVRARHDVGFDDDSRLGH